MLNSLALVLVALLAPVPLGGGAQPLETGALIPSSPSNGGQYGRSLDFEGNTAVVGAVQNKVRIFVQSGGAWMEEDVVSGVSGVTEFGSAVAVFGDTLVVGAPRQTVSGQADAGAAYVFVRNGSTWSQQALLSAPVPGAINAFGTAVAVLGDTIAIGTPAEDVVGTQNSGAVHVFTRSGSTWSPQQRLVASSPTTGDQFGSSVALESDELAVGAVRGGAFSEGAIYVFGRSGSVWSQQVQLLGGGTGDFLGSSVDISGDRIVAGGFGTAAVFARGTSSWSLEDELTVSGLGYMDKFGEDVAIEGDAVLVGAPDHSNSFGTLAGSAFVFRRGSGGWQEESCFTAGSITGFDRFGTSVALSGSTVLVGAPIFGSPGTGGVFAFLGGGGAPVSYCTAGSSTSGCQALLSGVGAPSASAATGFTLAATAVEGARDGLFFWGTAGRQANPWGNGTSFQCVVPPVKRSALVAGSGTANTCTGSLSTDLNARWTAKPNQNPGAGALVQAQLWYRDPLNTSNQTTSLSDALEFLVQP